MNDITIRFLIAYEYLKANNKVLNPRRFAFEINVSNSLITEICKKRTNAGITPVQNIVVRYPELDANWLLTGEGTMIKNENFNFDTVQNKQEKIIMLEQINKLQSKIIVDLESKVNHLEKESSNSI